MRALFLGMCLAGVTIPASAADDWRRIEADNGAAFAIEMNSIAHYNNGTADAAICVLDNGMCARWNMGRFHFDCQGHYMDLDNMPAGAQPAPPRSVIGRMAALACAGAKDSRLREGSGTQPTPSAAEYCAGFSSDACDRIKAVVDSKTSPAFCQPGFALVGSALTVEQLRMCYVTAPYR